VFVIVILRDFKHCLIFRRFISIFCDIIAHEEHTCRLVSFFLLLHHAF
jgi:hypothetical protein